MRDVASLRRRSRCPIEAITMARSERSRSAEPAPPLQTPSLLGVAWRAPFMHDGCAPTLADRFDPACGGDQHGDVSALSDADLGALVAYLETL